MKINKVILASNENREYLDFWPIVSNAWKRLDVEPVLIYTGKENIKLSGNVVNFYIKNLDSTFVAQNIRLLAPSIFKNDNCIISDIDSLPLSRDYFINSVKNISDNSFIIYRPDAAAFNMIPICWNLAKGSKWSEIFDINSKQKIERRLKNWYVFSYKFKRYKWYTDQIILKQYIDRYRKKSSGPVVKLDDNVLNFKRFDRISIEQDLKELNDGSAKFSEFHMPRPYDQYKDLINEVYEKSISSE